MVVVDVEGKVIEDADWPMVKCERIHGGVNTNCLTWKNWEKPLMTIAEKGEKEGPTLEVMGNAEIEGDTKDCKGREEGEKITYDANDCNPWLSLALCSLRALGLLRAPVKSPQKLLLCTAIC